MDGPGTFNSLGTSEIQTGRISRVGLTNTYAGGKMTNLNSFENLEATLTDAGVGWSCLSPEEHSAEWERWVSVYGDMFQIGAKCRQGLKAQVEYSQVAPDRWIILSIHDRTRIPYCDGRHTRFGYECSGSLVPLDAFHMSEFVVYPPDLSWTMIHTHEDDGFGGPFFSRREWQIPLRGRRSPRKYR